MKFPAFTNLSEVDKTTATEKLIEQSTPSQDFFFMMALSVLMATFGILINNIAVVIGSMLIAPLLSPVLSLSLGVILADKKLISRSLTTIGKSAALGVAAAALVAIFFGGNQEIAPEMLRALDPSYLYIAIAIIAGLAASFALVKPKLNEMLPGVVIAVALIPPIALMGVGIAQLSWTTVTNGLLVFLLNAFGIVFASMIMFSLMNFYVKRAVARETVEEEEEKLKKEQGQTNEALEELGPDTNQNRER